MSSPKNYLTFRIKDLGLKAWNLFLYCWDEVWLVISSVVWLGHTTLNWWMRMRDFVFDVVGLCKVVAFGWECVTWDLGVDESGSGNPKRIWLVGLRTFRDSRVMMVAFAVVVAFNKCPRSMSMLLISLRAGSRREPTKILHFVNTVSWEYFRSRGQHQLCVAF